jgi:uncharacterized protein YkwD
MRQLVLTGVAITAAFLLVRPHLLASAISPQPTTPAPAFVAPSGLPNPNDIYSLVNRERLLKGLSPLERDAALSRIAQQRAQDMTDRHYYNHQSPDGLYFYDLIRQANHQVAYACENLDLAYTLNATSYVSDWLLSAKGHRECLLDNRVTSAGYAVTSYQAPGSPTSGYIVVAIHAQTVQ